jgi:hypothetical protein
LQISFNQILSFLIDTIWGQEMGKIFVGCHPLAVAGQFTSAIRHAFLIYSADNEAGNSDDIIIRAGPTGNYVYSTLDVTFGGPASFTNDVPDVWSQYVGLSESEAKSYFSWTALDLSADGVGTRDASAV